MHNKTCGNGIVRLSVSTATAILALHSGAVCAQSTTSKSSCTVMGATYLEPVGDRDGHSLQTSVANCRIEGGDFDGAVSSLHTVWEQDKLNGNVLSGDGVLRKPGAMASYRQISGQRTYVLKDGKVVGWTATGKAIYNLASGGFAAYAGKSFTWSARSTMPGQFAIETAME